MSTTSGSRIDVFLDSSALFAGVASSAGAAPAAPARALLLLAEADRITITVSEKVITETERALARKLPAALGYSGRHCAPLACASFRTRHQKRTERIKVSFVIPLTSPSWSRP